MMVCTPRYFATGAATAMLFGGEMVWKWGIGIVFFYMPHIPAKQERSIAESKWHTQCWKGVFHGGMLGPRDHGNACSIHADSDGDADCDGDADSEADGVAEADAETELGG